MLIYLKTLTLLGLSWKILIVSDSLIKKVSGKFVPNSKFWDFNDMIFSVGLHVLSPIGLSYSWSNNKSLHPIHIRLDGVLVNDKWPDIFPLSYYKIDQTRCSKHSPIIVFIDLQISSKRRFQFKNY